MLPVVVGRGRSEGPEAEQDLAGGDQLALPGEVGHDPAAERAADGDAGRAVADLAEQVARLDVGRSSVKREGVTG